MHSAMPTTSDLTAYLNSMGSRVGLVVSGGTLDLTSALNNAIETLESETNYDPFLADITDVTLLYSPSNILFPPNDYPFLEFSAAGGSRGVVSVTSIKVNKFAGSAGRLLVAGTDYALRPHNAPLKKLPYTYIEFIGQFGLGIGNQANSIEVICKRGYWNQVPEAAWQYVLSCAALRLLPSLYSSVTSGVTKREAGDESETYGDAWTKFNGLINTQAVECLKTLKGIRFK